MNQPLALEAASVSIGAPFEGARRGGGSFTEDLERMVKFYSFQVMCKRRLWKQASLSIEALLGNLGVGVHLLVTLRYR